MVTQADSIQQRVAGIQRGLVALASRGVGVVDRERLRTLWMQAGSGARDPLLASDPKMRQMVNRHLQWVTGEAETIAAKYSLELDTSDTTCFTKAERDEAREGIAFGLSSYRSGTCPTCGR
ncbi:Uncharacterised protein [Mycobacteroides abscessus subsp. abscessus]|uniref:hypothetical protein n=1 Tax=Mycobacteroides abscessus TaxID=36809 RepID=UPI000929B117|nr:hypothetical protein [Mycobacteroides abscessus]SHY53509.1 Uncharacterised protein [Mycobacteroides abscessus subsp. abscessus]